MAHGFVPIAMMGEQFNPMDSLAQTAQLQAAYQQSQIRQMQIAEMQRQTQEANAQRMAARNAATYAPMNSVTAPAQSIGGAMSENAPDGQPALTLPQRTYSVQGPAGADFRNQYISQLGQLGQGQMIPGAQQEFAQQDMAKAKLLQEQQKTVDEHNASQALAKKNTAEAGNFDASKQAKQLDAFGSGAQYLLSLPDAQAQQAWPTVVQHIAGAAGIDAAQFLQQHPTFDRQFVTSVAKAAISAKDQMAEQNKAPSTQQLGSGPQGPGVYAYNPQTQKYDIFQGKLPKQVAPAININAAGDTPLDDPAIDQAAKMYLKTGQLPSLGMGKAAADDRRKIINRAAKLDSGADLATNKAGYKADAGALDKVVGMKNAVEAYENTASKNLDLFIEQAKNVPDTGIPIFNAPARALAEKMGSEKVSAYNAARQVALTEISRVVNNPNLVGVLSDSARQEIETFNPKSATLAQTLNIAKVLRTDMKNRHDSLVEQERTIRARIGGGNTAQSTQPASGGNEIHYKIVNGQLVAQ